MKNDLDALVERVKELRAQLEACNAKERKKKMQIQNLLDSTYSMILLSII